MLLNGTFSIQVGSAGTAGNQQNHQFFPREKGGKHSENTLANSNTSKKLRFPQQESKLKPFPNPRLKTWAALQDFSSVYLLVV